VKTQFFNINVKRCVFKVADISSIGFAQIQLNLCKLLYINFREERHGRFCTPPPPPSPYHKLKARRSSPRSRPTLAAHARSQRSQPTLAAHARGPRSRPTLAAHARAAHARSPRSHPTHKIEVQWSVVNVVTIYICTRTHTQTRSEVASSKTRT
jgi:hypothetical protein